VAWQSGRRSIKNDAQAAWLLRAVTCIDLTTLAGDDTRGNVRRLCAKALQPVRQDILDGLGVGGLDISTGAVCVYPARVVDAAEALQGTSLGVAAVATGFPSGQIKTEHKLQEIRAAVADGATEIDIVISRDLALRGEWGAVYEEVAAFREACGEAHMKTILATGDLATYQTIKCAASDPCICSPAVRVNPGCHQQDGVDGLHDGGRRFHQDVDRQGEYQCHLACQPCNGTLYPRVPRAYRL
jgi:deoxyribose-phosphate aldolase